MRRVDRIEFADFEWDEQKRHHVLTEREIDFVHAAEALLRPHLETKSFKQGEARTLAICTIGGKVVAVVYTVREQTCRIITARAARRYEREEYNQVFC